MSLLRRAESLGELYLSALSGLDDAIKRAKQTQNSPPYKIYAPSKSKPQSIMQLLGSEIKINAIIRDRNTPAAANIKEARKKTGKEKAPYFLVIDPERKIVVDYLTRDGKEALPREFTTQYRDELKRDLEKREQARDN